MAYLFEWNILVPDFIIKKRSEKNINELTAAIDLYFKKNVDTISNLNTDRTNCIVSTAMDEYFKKESVSISNLNNEKTNSVVAKAMEDYFQREAAFISNYNKERINYIISKLGISMEQYNQLQVELIRMRCENINNIEDARNRLKRIIKSDSSIIINQSSIPQEARCYDKVVYFLNFSDIAFIGKNAAYLAYCLMYLVTDNCRSLDWFDKIVIPHDSNFILGVEVGKRLTKPIVKMRVGDGRIDKNQHWDGNLDPQDRIIIVHDVLVTGNQIKHVLEHIPETCQVQGLFCLVARTECGALDILKNENIEVYSLIELSDNDIDKLSKEVQK